MDSRSASFTGPPEPESDSKSPTKPFRFLSGLVNERSLLRQFKQQRAKGQFPSGAFVHAATEVEWIPGDEEPSNPPIANFLTIDEIKQLTHRIAFELPVDSPHLPSPGPKHRFTEAEVEQRHAQITAFLKANGAKTPTLMAFESAGRNITPAVCEIMLSKRHSYEMRYIKRRHLRYDHPLYGMNLPLKLPIVPQEYKLDLAYPHMGNLIYNIGSKQKHGDIWALWTGFYRRDLEFIPNNQDNPLLVQLHEIAHIAQGPQIRLLNTNLECDYRIEHHADTYSLEGYRRLGASRGLIELQIAMNFMTRHLNPPKKNDFTFYQSYWYGMPLLHGKDGPDRWPLYRSAAAVMELHYLGAAYLFGKTTPYDSRLMNQVLKESILSLHEHPPKEADTSFSYSHLRNKFNSLARHQHFDKKKMETVRAFNVFSEAKTKLRERKYRNVRHLGLLAAFRQLWFSKQPLNDDTLLMLALTLEATALFKPSLHANADVPGIFTPATTAPPQAKLT